MTRGLVSNLEWNLSGRNCRKYDDEEKDNTVIDRNNEVEKEDTSQPKIPLGRRERQPAFVTGTSDQTAAMREFLKRSEERRVGKECPV